MIASFPIPNLSTYQTIWNECFCKDSNGSRSLHTLYIPFFFSSYLNILTHKWNLRIWIMQSKNNIQSILFTLNVRDLFHLHTVNIFLFEKLNLSGGNIKRFYSRKLLLLSNYHFSFLDLNLKGNLNFIYISFISIQIEFEYGVFMA